MPDRYVLRGGQRETAIVPGASAALREKLIRTAEALSGSNAGLYRVLAHVAGHKPWLIALYEGGEKIDAS